MEKKCKKAKWLSEEALQIAVKRRESKSKGEKERYNHLNAEFQRIARRDKKAHMSGIIQYLFFCILLISLSIMFSRLINIFVVFSHLVMSDSL